MGSYFGVGEAGERDEEGKDKAREGFHFEGKKKKTRPRPLFLPSFPSSLNSSSIIHHSPSAALWCPIASPVASSPNTKKGCALAW